MMNVAITKGDLYGRLERSIIYSLLLVTLLVFSSQQAQSKLLPMYRELIVIEPQASLIDLSVRPEAEAFSDINALLNTKKYQAAIDKANSVLKAKPDSGLANEILGTAYYLRGEQQKAIRFLQKAAKLEPNQSGPLTKLGSIYMESGTLDEAETLLLQAIEINTGERYAHQRLGLLYEYQKKNQLAIHHFRLGLTGTANSYLGVAANLGRLLNKSSNYKATITTLEPRLPLNNTLTEAHLILARAYLATGSYPAARLRYQRVLELDKSMTGALLGLAKAQQGEGELPAALITVNKFIELEANDANGQLVQGDILLRLNQKKKANAAFERALSMGVSRSNVKQRIALFHLNRKEFAQARDIYQEMVNAKTADVLTYSQLSELLMAQGDIEQGEQVLRKGIEQLPNNGYLHLRLGSYLASIRQYDKSLAALKKATELLPDDATIWKTYAFALSRAGQTGNAAKAGKRLYDLLPYSIETTFLYASLLEANSQLVEAETIYRKIVKSVPRHALALNNLADILASKENYSEAEKMARLATDIVSDNGNIQDTLGWILYKQGQLQEALKVLEYANRLAPEEATICYHKGVVMAETGQPAEARVALEKALSLNATADWVGDAKERLQK